MIWLHDRMKCETWKPSKHDVWGHFVQPKRDGLRVTFFKQPNGELFVFGRKTDLHLEMSDLICGTEDRDWRSWYYCLRDVMPPKSSVDGELWSPGEPATSVITRLKEKSHGLLFTPFAVPFWNGENLAMRDWRYCRDLIRTATTGLVTFETTHDWDPSETEEYLLDRAELCKLEGWVIKGSNYRDWYKIKRLHTIDAIVTDIKPGNGKYSGQCGALIVSLVSPQAESGLVEIANVSGMDDATRAAISHSDIGRVVEIKFQSVAAKGRLQMPRFIRWRDDKPATECTLDQLPPQEPNGGADAGE